MVVHVNDRLCVCVCVSGFIWAEIKEMWDGGFTEYIHDWWNLMDFAMNSLYLATISLKIVAYVKVRGGGGRGGRRKRGSICSHSNCHKLTSPNQVKEETRHTAEHLCKLAYSG